MSLSWSQNVDDFSVVYCNFLADNDLILERLARNVVALGQYPRDKQIFASVFSTIHTIKGTCDYFGFDKLGQVVQVSENLLTLLNDGAIRYDAAHISALLALVDAVRKLLAHIAATGEQNDVDYADLVATLSRLQVPSAGGPSHLDPGIPTEAGPAH